GNALNWDDNSEADLAGYNVYRSDAVDGTYTPVNAGGPISGSSYLDTGAPAGATSFYHVTAVDLSNLESDFSATSAFRPAPDLPPATPQNLVATGSQSGIALDWDDNTEADLKGYN